VALEHEDAELREKARQALRGFIDQIVIPPGDARGSRFSPVILPPRTQRRSVGRLDRLAR
jgi:hypothetical protein